MKPQALFVHVAVALAAPGQAFAHIPQWATSVDVLVSHPFAGAPSQSPKGAVHEKPQVLPLHVGVALAAPGQTFPQKPQLFASVAGVDSQPSAMLPLQSAEPALQTAMQVLLTQTPVAEG